MTLNSPFNPASALTSRVQLADEGAIIRMAQKVRELTAQGHHVINLIVGEPDFDTPSHIQEAATKAMREGFTHYSPVIGMPQLREAIAHKLQRDNNLGYKPQEILITNGAKQALTNAILATVEAGDEVIILAPFWVTYESLVRFAQGTPIILNSTVAENYKVPHSRIAAAITPRTKLLILNSPNNPSGAVWQRDELEDIAGLVRANPRMMVLSDEIYESIIYDATPCSIASLPGMHARTITVNGFSKSYAMTGWRLGYSAAVEPLTRAMTRMQAAFTSAANQFVQIAGVDALLHGQAAVEMMRQHYQDRRDLVLTQLRSMGGVSINDIPATFYALPDVSALLGKKSGTMVLHNIEEFCEWLLTQHGVATVPGTAFGAPKALRLSFAASTEKLNQALSRMRTAFASLT